DVETRHGELLCQDSTIDRAEHRSRDALEPLPSERVPSCTHSTISSAFPVRWAGLILIVPKIERHSMTSMCALCSFPFPASVCAGRVTGRGHPPTEWSEVGPYTIPSRRGQAD
ncbi:unnamed protein product, partial [Scytosiphon promiscuus]